MLADEPNLREDVDSSALTYILYQFIVRCVHAPVSSIREEKSV